MLDQRPSPCPTCPPDAPEDGRHSASRELAADVFVIPVVEDCWLIYAPLRRVAFLADADLTQTIAALQEADEPPPLSPDIERLLRELKLIGGGPQPAPIGPVTGDAKPTAVTLFLTTACNLRCTYCYASAGDTPLRQMDLATAQHGIDYVVDNAVAEGAPSFTVNFHGGGEPTANWTVLTGALRHAAGRAMQHRLTLNSYMATNGLLSSERADWISRHLTGCMVSFDGVPVVQDRHRPTVGGRASSSQVLATLSIFDRRKFPYGVRMTVTADAVSLLPESVAFILDNCQPRRLQVEPAFPLGRWQNQPSAESREFIEMYRRADEIARRRGHTLFFSGARLDTISSHFCGVTRDNFALSPDGNVSACFEVFSESSPLAGTFFYGSPESDTGRYKFNLPVLQNLRHQTVEHREFCTDCFAKWNCSGDCYHRSIATNGGQFAGSDRCHITRELLKDQLLERIAGDDGVRWIGGPWVSPSAALLDEGG